MGKQDDEGRSFLVENGSESDVNLRKTRCASLFEEGMAQTHMIVLDLVLHAGFTRTPECVSTNELEVFCYIVHLLAFHICDNDVYIVAANVVHPSEHHQLRKHSKYNRHHGQFSVLH